MIQDSDEETESEQEQDIDITSKPIKNEQNGDETVPNNGNSNSSKHDKADKNGNSSRAQSN